jgi:hypothetical protein
MKDTLLLNLNNKKGKPSLILVFEKVLAVNYLLLIGTVPHQ